MSTVVDEGMILDTLRQIPSDRWVEVLQFLETLVDAEPPIRTGPDMIRSGLAGLWSERDDIGDSQEFARISPHSVLSGADLLAFWQAGGLVGSRPEIADIRAYARELREQARNRRP